MKEHKGVWIPDKETANFWSDKYDEKEYNKLNLSGNVCLDIGAHVGLWTKRLSKDFSKVICFEPLQKHIECHKKNCEGLDNITLHECALSDVEANGLMKTQDYNSGISSLQTGFKDKLTSIDPHSFKENYMVKTKTLDSFNLSGIDFIKIDVEGYELHVLSGGRETIAKNKPKLFIEIWNSNLRSASYILSEMGYSLIKMSNNVDSLQQNYLAVVK